MKNQYFGDINDYRKYGLLRAIQASGELSLLVGWMLTPDDGGSDGKKREYLHDSVGVACCDHALFEHISASLASGSPSVRMMEGGGILPRARFFSEFVPDDRPGRAAWSAKLVQAAVGMDWVFLDPDTGIEVPSTPIGCKGSSKYVAWREIEQLWEAGFSLLVYQHHRRVRHEEFARRAIAELRRHTGAAFAVAFDTDDVLFLLAGQPRHEPVFRQAIVERLSDWARQINMYGLDN